MTIGIDMRSYLTGPPTGVGIHLKGLVSGLAALDRDGALTDRYVLCSTGFKHDAEVSQKEFADIPFPWKHIAIPNKVVTSAWLLTQSPSMRSLFSGVDYWLLPNIGLYPQRRIAPYAVTVHDLSFMHYPSWYSFKRRLWHRAIRLQKLLAHANCIVTVSESTATAIREVFPGLASKRIVVISPAVQDSAVVPEENSLLKKLPKKYILFVGTLEPRKNIDAVILAYRASASQHPGLELVLAGQFGWSVRNIVQSIARDTRIHWLRYVSENDKALLFKHAQVVVWPSFYEGFGFPPLEALREGTPVITSYRTSIPEVLGVHAFYSNPYNAGELAAVLNQVLTQQELPEIMRQIPARFAERSWKQVASEYVAAMKGVI